MCHVVSPSPPNKCREGVTIHNNSTIRNTFYLAVSRKQTQVNYFYIAEKQQGSLPELAHALEPEAPAVRF